MSVVKHLTKKYGEFVIHVPSLSMEDQGVTSLVGTSGSGKTSFLRILSGLDSCSSLEWIFEKKDLAKLPIEERNIGFVFQNLELFPHMNVKENINFAAQARGGVKLSHFDFLIHSLDLSLCLRKKASSISRGEAQRTALARSLIVRPRILFLDEPFSSLDEENKKKARQLVKILVQEWKIPVILVSHDTQDVESLSHTVVFLKNGRIQSIEKKSL